MAIALKPAHDALENLIKELESLPPEKLVELEAKAKKKIPTPKLTTALAWMTSLRMAREGLEEWCPGGGFFIDSEPNK